MRRIIAMLLLPSFLSAGNLRSAGQTAPCATPPTPPTSAWRVLQATEQYHAWSQAAQLSSRRLGATSKQQAQTRFFHSSSTDSACTGATHTVVPGASA